MVKEDAVMVFVAGSQDKIDPNKLYYNREKDFRSHWSKSNESINYWNMNMNMNMNMNAKLAFVSESRGVAKVF
jgi:hypothetical protein